MRRQSDDRAVAYVPKAQGGSLFVVMFVPMADVPTLARPLGLARGLFWFFYFWRRQWR